MPYITYNDLNAVNYRARDLMAGGTTVTNAVNHEHMTRWFIAAMQRGIVNVIVAGVLFVSKIVMHSILRYGDTQSFY